MRPSTEQYQALSGMLAVGISLVHVPDPDDAETMRIVFNNAAASSMSEVDLREVVGKLFLEAFPGLRGSPASGSRRGNACRNRRSVAGRGIERSRSAAAFQAERRPLAVTSA